MEGRSGNARGKTRGGCGDEEVRTKTKKKKNNVTWSSDGQRFSCHCPDDVARFGYACKLFDGRSLSFMSLFLIVRHAFGIGSHSRSSLSPSLSPSL